MWQGSGQGVVMIKNVCVHLPVPRVHAEFNLLQLTGFVGVCPKGTPLVLCLPSLALKLI